MVCKYHLLLHIYIQYIILCIRTKNIFTIACNRRVIHGHPLEPDTAGKTGRGGFAQVLVQLL